MRFVRIENKEGTPPTSMDILDNTNDPRALTHGIMDTKARTRVKGYNYLRLGEIDGCCPREWVIGHRTDSRIVDRVDFSMVCVMDMGSALHNWIQNSNVYFGNRLVGFWRCAACGNVRRFGVKPTEPCEFCSASHMATFYSEYMFRIEHPFRVVGKMDAIVRFGDVYRIVEIKTYGGDLTGPRGADIAQLASYIYFSQFDESDRRLPIQIDRSVGYLVYFSKMFNYRDPVKTFSVYPSSRLMSPLIRKAEQFTNGVKTGMLPPVINSCLNTLWGCKKAKTCSVLESCKSYHQNRVNSLEGV